MKIKGNLSFCEDDDDCDSIKTEFLRRNATWTNLKRDWVDFNDSMNTIIISCMDSRVPVEKIFDLKPGEVLIIRNAGNIIREDVVRSVIAGIYEIHVKYIILMGHTRCGMAVKDNEVVINELIDSLPKKMLEKFGLKDRDEIIEWFGFFDDGKWEENARESAETLENMLKKLIDEEKIPEIIIACYDLDSGQVNFI